MLNNENNSILNNDILKYTLIEIKEKDIYVYKTPIADNRQQFLYNIRQLYKDLKTNNMLKRIDEIGMFGITEIKSEKNQVYYVGCENKFENTEKITILPGTYAVFNCNGNNQINIAPLVDKIYEYAFIFPNFKIDKSYCFEKYIDDTCYLYIKVN